MNELMVERIFAQMDKLAKTVEELSKIVYTDSVLLQIIHKIVFCIVLAMITGAIGFGWFQLQKTDTRSTEQVVTERKVESETQDHRVYPIEQRKKH